MKGEWQRRLLWLCGRTDLVLAILLVAVIFMMILPLPTMLVDVLLASSMSLSVLLLMLALYVASPLAFTAFPAVLLISTLFRLSLTISTTRLVLLQADAGEIVKTFGHFVVQGNLTVGLVVFLIITIVQFVVITKGSERVAEVSARFSLDAMPGKQMSIDSDMRAGVIDVEEAQRRRRMLTTEAQLHGAMDGAMKFVKGDAIAGIIVILVNMIGGISVGMLQRGMAFEQALHTYSILTVGDGLVSQIPALFVSITAGIIVTRISEDQGESNLGSDIGRQIVAQPNALAISSAVVAGFALIPGFPAPVFLLLSAALGGAAYVVRRRQATAGAQAHSASGFAPAIASDNAPGGRTEDVFAPLAPIVIEVAADLQDIITTSKLNAELGRLRRALFHDLGVPFPGIHLRFNTQAQDGVYRIHFQDVPVARGEIRRNALLLQEDAENLAILGVEVAPAIPVVPGVPALWVADHYRDPLAKAQFSFLEPGQILTHHLSYILKRYSDEFIGIQETRLLLARMEDSFPELVKEVQRVVPIQKISEILRRLVSEEISIRDLRRVLEAMLEWGQKEKDSVLLVEYIRGALKRYISYKFSAGQNMLPAYLMAPEAEDRIRNAIRQTSAGSYLALDPQASRNFVEGLRGLLKVDTPKRRSAVILTSMDVRRYVRKLIEADFYEVPVLSYQELTSEITIQPLGRITM